jgi:penicillin-binding protein 2
MKIRTVAILFLLLLVSCKASPTLTGTKTATTPAPPSVLPTAKVFTTHTPEVRDAATEFLTAWQSEDYEKMYALLSPASQDATPKENFLKRYHDVAVTMTLQKLDFEILSTLKNTSSAQAAYQVIFHTAVLGDFTRSMTMYFELRDGNWKVLWDDGMIMPELHGGNLLAQQYKTPARGNIYDRNGDPIAVTTDAVAVGMVPQDFSKGGEGTVLSELSQLTGKPQEWIKALYGESYPNWYIPVGETTKDEFDLRSDVLKNLSGFQYKPYTARYYFNQGIAPHVVGYVQPIFKEELETYQRQGYAIDEKVGKSGLEKWGQQALAGQKYVALYVTDAEGRIITRLATRDAVPSQSIYTTIDAKLQVEAQKAMNGFNGAIVVMERDSGRVLAMVSSPGYDPNYIEPENLNSSYGLAELNDASRGRLVNRAANGGGYPLGSVFKIVTMATALETGEFTADSTYDCQTLFTEDNFNLKDWTFDKKLPASGMLTLPEGLMRSCNPWFYHIGLTLWNDGKANELSKMARAFGLGVETGIGQIDENAGNMPDPTDKNDAVQMAIGQGKILVTPLQVADMVAAVGNGGTLYRPQVVEKIVDPDGKASYEFKAEERGKLPISQDNLKIIQDAMRQVIINSRGTAVRAFSGLAIPIYGKTGTASSDDPANSHAWFAAYTDAQRSDKPDISVAVIAEYAGEGSEIAAPITRRIIEVYFLGQAQRVYPWEAKMNVTKTPAPTGTPTPAP